MERECANDDTRDDDVFRHHLGAPTDMGDCLSPEASQSSQKDQTEETVVIKA